MSRSHDPRPTARRSWTAQSAHRTGGGAHEDGRDARRERDVQAGRRGTRRQRNERAMRDGWAS